MLIYVRKCNHMMLNLIMIIVRIQKRMKFLKFLCFHKNFMNFIHFFILSLILIEMSSIGLYLLPNYMTLIVIILVWIFCIYLLVQILMLIQYSRAVIRTVVLHCIGPSTVIGIFCHHDTLSRPWAIIYSKVDIIQISRNSKKRPQNTRMFPKRFPSPIIGT